MEQRQQTELERRLKQLEGLIADIKKQLQEESLRRQTLEDQDKERAQFITLLGHELRTALTPVLASARLLAEQFHPQVGSPQYRLISSIVRGAEALEERLSDILDIAQIQAGVFQVEKRVIEPAGLINDVVLQFVPLAESKRQALSLDLPQRLPLVKADRRRIAQVLMNLLGNAVKFTPEGGNIEVKAAVRAPNLAIEVHNSGTGFSAEEKQRLFQPYYRNNNVDRQRLPGSGLGLFLCRRLIESHGGRIWVESVAGKGNVFGFTLPLEDAVSQHQEGTI
jgi:signal transduction histidine kinase